MSKKKRVLFIVILMIIAQVFAAIPADADDVPREKVIFDTDNGEFGDDTKALFMLINSGRYDILGITTVIGNYWVESSTAHTLRHLEIIGRADIPVYQGMDLPLRGDHTPYLGTQLLPGIIGRNIGYMGKERPVSYKELPQESIIGFPTTDKKDKHAVDFMAEQIMFYPNEVTIICVGAATNIAMMVKRYPETGPLIKQVIYMGGAFDEPCNTTAAAEFNWRADPWAMKIMSITPIENQIVVPKDICYEARIRYQDYEKIKAAPETPATRLFLDISGPNHEKDKDYVNTLWDEVTVLYLLDDSFVTRWEDRYVDIDTSMGINYGRSIGFRTDPRRPDDFYIDPNVQKMKILLDMDVEKFMNLYVHYYTMKSESRE